MLDRGVTGQSEDAKLREVAGRIDGSSHDAGAPMLCTVTMETPRSPAVQGDDDLAGWIHDVTLTSPPAPLPTGPWPAGVRRGRRRARAFRRHRLGAGDRPPGSPGGAPVRCGQPVRVRA
ncbi:hypothetical protein GCM10010266_31450 [Streptomyces griseomycini]|nr:hypothetical protein GCM10010266_31450 [Streptomyces griseomycini]GGR21114.1 hypothetical protein GCM10015536_28400 [Streptomyces griseomycini]